MVVVATGRRRLTSRCSTPKGAEVGVDGEDLHREERKAACDKGFLLLTYTISLHVLSTCSTDKVAALHEFVFHYRMQVTYTLL